MTASGTFVKLTRKQYEALGSIMLPGSGPYGLKRQLHRSTAKHFLAAGLISERRVILPGPFRITVVQHDLTELGNLVYCEWASRQQEAAA